MTYRNPARSAAPGSLLRALLVGSLGLGACSRGGQAAEPSTTPTATAPSPAPTTSDTTTEATTPATDPTTTFESVEAAIRAAHTRVMTELFARDERETGPEAMLILAQELTTGPLLDRITEGVAQRAESGERSVGPGYVSNIVEVTIMDETNAQVLDCSQGLGERYSADGVLMVPADDFYKLRESEMVLVDGRWLAREINTGGDLRCDPNE